MPEPSGTPWIRIRDFAEITFWISVTNNTTKTPVPRSAAIEVTEISMGGMILKMPARSCAKGHLLGIRIERRRWQPLEPKGPRNPVREDGIDVTAKVIQVEKLGEKFCSVIVQFYQVDQDHWQGFLNEYGKRQSAVSQVIRNMKE